MTFAGVRQNQTPKTEQIANTGVLFGVGAIPASGTNWGAPQRPCCLSYRRDSVCSDLLVTDYCRGKSFGRLEAPTPKTGCESLALHQFLTGEERLVWNDYYELQAQVTKLECFDFENPRLPVLRAMLLGVIPVVDALLDKAAEVRAQHIHAC